MAESALTLSPPGGLPPVKIPAVTLASLAVYSVMGCLGYGLTHVRSAKHLGEGLVVAAFIGGGYAVSHAIVTNVAPNVAQSLSGDGQRDGVT